MITSRHILQEFNENKWKEISTHPFYKEQIRAIRSEADRLLHEPIPAVSFSDYHLYFETGNRLQYEFAYFERRKRLNIYAFMYLLERSETYLRPLNDIIWAILDEFTWSLPAHASETLSLKEQHTMLDLFASETGYTLSELYFLLHDSLPSLLTRRMKQEIQERVIDAFLSLENGTARWEQMTNNWAAVCAGSVGNAFLYMATDAEWEQAKPRLLLCMEHFLSGFSDDGACLEGYTYWQYGFGYFLQFAETLRQYTNNKEDLLASVKVQNIAKFQQNCILDDRLSLPISDANNEYFQQDLYITHYLYRHFDGIEIPDQSMSYHFGDDHCHRWGGFIRYFLWTDPSLPQCTLNKKSFYFKDAAWYIRNTKEYAFMTKAGNNDEPHNHNDIGHFSLSHKNHFLLYDLGAGEYTASYFQEETRYDHITNSSFGHSVPIINGIGQKAGKEYYGTILKESEKELSLSLEHAYPISELTSLVRTFQFGEQTIQMTDSYQFESDADAQQVTECLVTKIEPVIQEDCVKINALSIRFDPQILCVSVTPKHYVGHQGSSETVYLIHFDVKKPSQSFHVTLYFSLEQ